MSKRKSNTEKKDELRPRCFMDISIGGREGNTPIVDCETHALAGRVVFELFSDKVPKTAENFRALCMSN